MYLDRKYVTKGEKISLERDSRWSYLSTDKWFTLGDSEGVYGYGKLLSPPTPLKDGNTQVEFEFSPGRKHPDSPFKLFFCDTCKAWNVECTKCGSISCNGGGGNCELCGDELHSLAESLHTLMYKTDLEVRL